jgi:hypothetical protein
VTALEDLLSRVSEAARCLPGAVELSLFGSAASPVTRDAYSDLDLRIITESFAASREGFPEILALAGRIELVYPLLDRPGECAFTIGFRGERLYHKVDIGLSARQDSGFFNQVKDRLLLWRQPAQVNPIKIAPLEAINPLPGTSLYFLFGELLSSVRYAKARGRGQHLTCWRFLSSKVNALLRCLQWDEDPQNFPQSALTPWEFAALDRALPEKERLRLLSSVKTGSPAEMDRSLLEITVQIAARICPGYQAQGTQAERLVVRYLQFLEFELSTNPHQSTSLFP